MPGDMNRVFYSVTLFWLAIKLGNVNAEDYCYATDPNRNVGYGTSSSYELNFPHPNLQIAKDNVCVPVYGYGLIRVGARYFGGYNTENLTKLKSLIVGNNGGKLCAPDLALLKSWSTKGEGKTSDDPAPRGRQEISNLAQRLGEVFKPYGASGPENYSFFQTSNPTSQDSTTHFIRGIFGGAANDAHVHNNEQLRFMENNPSLEAKLTEPALKMRKVCENSAPMRALIKEVSTVRLGLAAELPIESIADMYFSCAFETAWAPKELAAFCAVFTKEHLKLLEYCYMDVFGYYEWGHGARNVHNPILDEMLGKISAKLSSKTGDMHMDLNIVSGPALTHFIAKLGLYRDDEHLPLECGLKKDQYKWSMTDICPFTGNLIVLLHNCGDEGRKVSLYHNERLIKVPGCSHELCSWPQFHNTVVMNNPAITSP